MEPRALREYLASLPGVEQRETWGHPTFRVRGKIFASLPDDTTVTIKASPHEQQALIAEDSDTFRPASRVGRFGWVSARIDRVAAARLRELIDTAWERTAPDELGRQHG